MLTPGVAAALALVMLGCPRGDDEAAADDQRPRTVFAARGRTPTNADVPPPAVPFNVMTRRDTARAAASFPHDAGAYTQGLAWEDGRLLEGTGLEGRSTVREVALETGQVRRQHALPRPHFGEGIAVVGDRLIQLTWQSGRGFTYDLASLAPRDSFAVTGEGWGLASDGTVLYMSDGSSRIRVLDPRTLQPTRTIDVREGSNAVHALNELEWVNGELWANIYQTDWIARIAPATGEVLGYLYVGALLTEDERRQVRQAGGVANGIAYDPARRRVLVTGKYWPRVFAVPVGR